MVLSLATTFDKELIDKFAEINSRIKDDRLKIKETFGAMITEFGSGRNAYRLPDISQDNLKDYIQYSHKKGIGFNYLINGTCFSGEDASKEFINKLCEHINKLSEAKVDIFTVANPILIKIAKENFRKIKINTSINSRIDSFRDIERFLSLGIDRITIHYDLNRDFNLIKKVRKRTNIDIELLANNPCLYKCIFADYHMNMDAHASRKADKNINTLYPVFNCKDTRLRNIEEIIKSRWIRPADIKEYFDLGINVIKIAGRNMNKKWLENAAEDYAYLKDSPTFYSSLIERGLWTYVSRHDPSLKELDIEIDLPKNFLDWFKEDKCIDDCTSCKHCEATAKKYVKFNSDNLRENYLKISKQILNNELKSKI